jgi:hypothetical protein
VLIYLRFGKKKQKKNKTENRTFRWFSWGPLFASPPAKISVGNLRSKSVMAMELVLIMYCFYLFGMFNMLPCGELWKTGTVKDDTDLVSL